MSHLFWWIAPLLGAIFGHGTFWNLTWKKSELGGPSGKLFRFVSCVRARGAYVRSDLGENLGSASFPFPFSPREVFPFPSALQGPIQLQLALSVIFLSGYWALLNM